MPKLGALVVFTKVPRSTKKMVASVREKYEAVSYFYSVKLSLLVSVHVPILVPVPAPLYSGTYTGFH